MSHVSRVQALPGANPPALGRAARPMAGEMQRGQVHLDSLPADWPGLFGLRPEAPWTAAMRRVLDVAFSLALLTFTLPLTLLLACLVRLDSPGPAFYRQERTGLHGRSFQLLKFRSMRVDAEATGPSWATQADPRVTRLGRIMRLTRMDELPQLLNVLADSMSLVGPRPERPCFVTQLAGQIPHFRERTRVKPGITGWAQVNHPYGASVEDAREKLAYDLYYLRHRSLMLDLRILLATVRVVVMQAGAR